MDKMTEESDDDIGDFMEVVTVYRCRFCSFQANTPTEMTEHVKMIHKKTKSKDTAPPSKVDTVNQTSIVIEDPPTLLETITSADDGQFVEPYSTSEEYPALDENVTEDTKGDHLNDLNHHMIAISSSGQVVAANDQIPSKPEQILSYHFVSRNNLGHYSILQNAKDSPFNMDGTIQVLVEDTGQITSIDDIYKLESGQGQTINGEEVHLEVQQSEEGQEMTQMAVDAEPTHIVVEASELDIGLHHQPQHKSQSTETETTTRHDNGSLMQFSNDEALSEVQHEGPSQPSDSLPDGDVATKELFLCGNCSQGFTSIITCKEHMIQEHGVNDITSSGKVDTGTQMEPRRRVGRKSNLEKQREKMKEKEEMEKETEEIIELIASDSDEDWTEQLHAHESRSRRKRQPPKMLQSEYYLGRSKKKTKDESGFTVKCDVKGCLVRLRDEETLNIHKVCHIEGAGKDEPQFKCPDCTEPVTFVSWKQLRYHIWKTHQREVDILTCDVCNMFKTDTMFKLKTHKEIHGTERPYTCDVCGKGFKQFAQMKNHQVIHYDPGSRPPAYMADRWHTPKVCDICGRKFANSKCLKNHKEQVHSGEKPFQCSYCSYTCSRKAMIILHMRSHTGEKPFRCDQCPYSTGDHNSLRRHQYRHTGQKPYKCPHCSYAAIQAISLKVHVKNKHPGLGGVFNCNQCLFRTVSKQQYDNHLMDHKHGLIKEVDNAVIQKNVRPRRSKNQPMVLQDSLHVITSDVNMPQLQHIQPVNGVPAGTIYQNINLPSGQLIQVPISSIQTNGEHVTQLEMQVQMNEAGESVISAEDLAKLTNCDGLVHSDSAAAQLIYSALSAMSQTNQVGQGEMTGQGITTDTGEIQTSIQTDNKEGVTTHTITFHLPGEEIGGEVTLQNL